jgi:uncharacterized protein YebE (UPF0316 family)
MLTASTLAWAAIIFFARICDVSLGTLRTVMIVRGARLLSALIGFAEVTIFIVVISRVITNIDSWVNVVAYAGGFAAGTFVGMTIESRLAPGRILMRVVSTDDWDDVSSSLRETGFGVTEIAGYGRSGPVVMLESVIRRRDMPRFVQAVEAVDCSAFITSEDMRSISRGYLMRRDKKK